jgi:glycosyltransferase involved in cell wall biosynthesis
MSEMKISFIIPLLNKSKTIALCIDSINIEKDAADEIIVVDNGSSDNSIDKVKKYENLKLLIKPKATVGAVRNAGARVAVRDVLAFIDADCLICKDWRIHLMKTLEEPSIAASGSKVGLPENACWIEKAWYSQRRSSPGKVNYINSGNFVVKSSAFFEVGGFNESLVTGEDSELCWRLSRAGKTVFENPNIKVVHLGNPKTLWNFYKQQRWHGLGMFGTFKISFIDKPVIMTMAFILCVLYSLMLALDQGSNSVKLSTLLSLVIIFFVPMVTSFYRCFQNSAFQYLPQLVLLYFLYFLARTDALVRICFEKHHSL